MATVYNHGPIGVIDPTGNVNVIYPQTYAKDVLVEQGENNYLIDKNINTVQQLAETIGDDIISLKTRTTAVEEITTISSAASHNALYRGKNITSMGVTDIINRISSGAFDDLYVGDYFAVDIYSSLGGVETVINVLADFDTYYNKGDIALTNHHAVIVPMYCFKSTAKMNPTSTTDGGYYSSDMRITTLPIYATALREVFREHLLSHRSYIANEVNNNTMSRAYTAFSGASSGCIWADDTLELMSEQNLIGSTIWGSSGFDVGLDNTRLSYFRHNPSAIITGLGTSGKSNYWLRSVVASSYFANVTTVNSPDTLGGGIINKSSANASLGVRPKYIIG